MGLAEPLDDGLVGDEVGMEQDEHIRGGGIRGDPNDAPEGRENILDLPSLLN